MARVRLRRRVALAFHGIARFPDVGIYHSIFWPVYSNPFNHEVDRYVVESDRKIESRQLVFQS